MSAASKQRCLLESLYFLPVFELLLSAIPEKVVDVSLTCVSFLDSDLDRLWSVLNHSANTDIFDLSSAEVLLRNFRDSVLLVLFSQNEMIMHGLIDCSIPLGRVWGVQLGLHSFLTRQLPLIQITLLFETLISGELILADHSLTI